MSDKADLLTPGALQPVPSQRQARLRVTKQHPDTQASTLLPDLRGPIALVDAMDLRRECTLSLLRSYLRVPLRAFASVGSLLEAAAGLRVPGSVLLCTGAHSVADEPWRGDVLRIRQALGSAPVIILSDRAELEDVVAAFRHGARGYILTSEEPRLAIEALRIVLAGNMYFPADVLMTQRTGPAPRTMPQVPGPQAAASGLTDRLAPRQLEVLRALADGCTNKDIAQRLLMEETTVKIHVRQIIRRLGVANRTQAALLAHRCGISQARGTGMQEGAADPSVPPAEEG
ncbi:LuxR C-terminal-related transcriptional regulator [Falsiroseomonas sp.]|uniref:LuxR C-terminal-related transcriptional regulator n=1 Tax=Falsiroseomonas sp. TaxID=2870721 RepID=UPI003569DC6B